MSGEEDDILAAEYALGLLDAADEARAQRLEARDAAFAAKVMAWAARFAGRRGATGGSVKVSAFTLG